MATRSRWHFHFALAAAVAGAAGWLYFRSNQRRSDKESTTTEWARLASTRQSLETRLVSAERERAKWQAELERLAKARAPAAGPPRPVGFPPRTAPDATQLAARAKQAKARLALKYASFFRTVGVDSVTAARFEQLLVEHEAEGIDLVEIARNLPAENRTEFVAEPYWPGSESAFIDPAIAAMRRRMTAQFEADQIALLGEPGYRRLQEYQREEGKRRIVAQLVGDLAMSEVPMTPTQTKQLAGLLAVIDFGGKPVADEKPWPEILARARGVLSASQLAMLKKQADKAESYAAQEAFSRILRESGK